MVRNALSLSSARLAAKFLAFLAGVLLARRLGSSTFGQYSVVITFALIFSYLADFGLVSLLIRDLARSPASTESVLGEALPLQLALSTITAVALVGVGFALETNGTVRLGLCAAAVGLFLESLGRPFTAVIISRQQILRAASIIVFTSVANTALILAVLTMDARVVPLIAVAIPVGLIGAALPALLCLKQWRLPPLTRPHPPFRLLGASLPFALLAGSVVLYGRVDVLMLAHLSNSRAVGVYSAADRLIEGILVIPAGIGASLYPSLAANAHLAWARLREALWWCLPMGAGITTLCIFPGALIASLIYGSEFQGIDSALRLLSCSVLLAFATVPLAYLLQARSRMHAALAATLLGLGTNVGLNLILMPRLSYNGASISASLAELVVLIALVSFLSRQPGGLRARA